MELSKLSVHLSIVFVVFPRMSMRAFDLGCETMFSAYITMATAECNAGGRDLFVTASHADPLHPELDFKSRQNYSGKVDEYQSKKSRVEIGIKQSIFAII
jgi:hypothetical protein